MKKKINHFIYKLQYVQIADILHIFMFLLALLPSWICRFILYCKKEELWLIAEEQYEARDNGYVLFEYIRRNHPDQLVFYAINPKSFDFKKVEELGNVITYGTMQHWIYYLSAKKNISTQKGGKPNAAVCYFLEVYGLRKNKRVFLQHGIVLNDLDWLYYEKTKISLFICGAKPEYEFVKEKFGYPKENIKYLGLCRFDQLHDFEVDKKKILFMPTWRNWISLETKNSEKFDDMTNFTHTEYYKTIQALLNNHKLINFIEEHEIDLYFYPHRNMQKFIKYFSTESKNIKITYMNEKDLQKLLQESALLITDYSSVSMDFAYMKKPVIYYQFDYEKFRQGHYKKGYFSYKKHGFGPVVYTVESLIREIKETHKNEFKLNEVYLQRHKLFFELYDKKNTSRNYEAILNL